MRKFYLVLIAFCCFKCTQKGGKLFADSFQLEIPFQQFTVHEILLVVTVCIEIAFN